MKSIKKNFMVLIVMGFVFSSHYSISMYEVQVLFPVCFDLKQNNHQDELHDISLNDNDLEMQLRFQNRAFNQDSHRNEAPLNQENKVSIYAIFFSCYKNCLETFMP